MRRCVSWKAALVVAREKLATQPLARLTRKRIVEVLQKDIASNLSVEDALSSLPPGCRLLRSLADFLGLVILKFGKVKQKGNERGKRGEPILWRIAAWIQRQHDHEVDAASCAAGYAAVTNRDLQMVSFSLSFLGSFSTVSTPMPARKAVCFHGCGSVKKIRDQVLEAVS